MVLCAGMGTRLGALTQDLPKPMLEVRGRPLLSYILANLRAHGVVDVTLNLHFQPWRIQEHFGDGADFGMRIRYSPEAVLLGTAGGVRQAADHFRDSSPILVHYGDVLTNQDLGAMVAFHRERGALATLLLHERARSNSIVCLGPGDRIESLLERPTESARQGVASPWVNSGVYLLEPEVLGRIPEGGPSDFPRDVFPGLIASGRVFGYRLGGYRCAIDSAQRLEQARMDLASIDWPVLPGERPLAAPADR